MCDLLHVVAHLFMFALIAWLSRTFKLLKQIRLAPPLTLVYVFRC